MKKYFLLILLITMLFPFIGCTDNYADYKQVDLPDNKTGSIKIPDNWEVFTDSNGWIYIKDFDSNSIIARQYYYGEYYNIGKTNYDTRVYNPYFENFKIIDSELKSGNSNQGQWGTYSVDINDERNDFKYLFFVGIDSDYQIRIIILDDTVDTLILQNIAKSYRRYE